MDAEAYRAVWYPFEAHRESDSCWSLSVGPDGRIYAAACCETVPAGVVKVVRYDENSDSLEYLFDMDEVVEDRRDSGRATQCKIHYSFAPSLSDGVMYMATHLSGPPIDEPMYSPWLSWHDERRCFRGSALVAFDTSKDKVLWWDTMLPKEGCRCLLHDEARGLLYALSYPRDHFFVYDLEKRKRFDAGRIGSINSQVLFLDSKGRVWTSGDYGHLIRYDPAVKRLERSPYVLPHKNGLQTGWHSVLYDAVASTGGDCVYAVTWTGYPRLIRIWPDDGKWGYVEDLGQVTQDYDNTLPVDTFIDHCGGLVFGGDGMLYYVGSRWKEPVSREYKDMEGVVWRMDTDSLEREEVAVLRRPGAVSQYVSRGAADHNGDLFFGHVNAQARPVGIFKVEMPAGRKKANAHLPLRMWG